MRLRSQIHLYSSVWFALLLILMNAAIYWIFSHQLMQSELARARAEAAHIVGGLRSADPAIPETELLRAYLPSEGMLRLIAEQGMAPAPVTAKAAVELAKLPVTYSAAAWQDVYRATDRRSYILTSVPMIWRDGRVVNVQTAENIEGAVDTLSKLRLVLLAVTALAIVPLVAAGGLLARLIMRPISAMTQTMRDIRQSGRFRRLELREPAKDELTEMGTTFNEMIGLLESNYEKQQQFVSNASHELKTPLTIIESYARLLQRRGAERPELQQEALEAIHSETLRMQELIEQLLMLARNKEQWSLRMEQLDLLQLTEESAKAFREAYHREILVEGAAVIPVVTDRNRLRQLLFILLDNACKYSRAEIEMTVGESGGLPFVRVTDHGVGIPQEEIPKVFDRFYRVDPSRTRQGSQVGGAGLGLALASELAEVLRARIKLESVLGVGTAVTITFTKGGTA
ncbi:sensor histidine kinase [Paenibacillus sp. SYP-B4298]|uniref:sensor histidine kinase n=1 Tax=Paenibacillus sp. SYP-B4298 TaxID=2996034 RepID=UPI0022DE6A62|nr:HAMP domain-containing sensor histidine kinase [Paenibacillus sp. SYP-B4298]